MSPAEVPAYLLERYGLAVTESSIRRWMAKGVRGVRLDATYIGGRAKIDRSSLELFVARVTEIKTKALPESGSTATD